MPNRRWEIRCKPGWDLSSPEDFKTAQEAVLRDFIREKVFPFHPHYARVFQEEGIDPESIRTISDLRRIPFTYKEDIAPSENDPFAPENFVLRPGVSSVRVENRKDSYPPGKSTWLPDDIKDVQALKEEYEPVITMFTTGRTAEPTPFFFTLYDLERLCEAGRRLASVVLTVLEEGEEEGIIAINNFPGYTHLAYWVAMSIGLGTSMTVVNTGGGTTMSQELVLNIIERMKPKMFLGLPGYTYNLFRHAASEGRDLSSISFVLMGGDRVTQGTKDKVSYLLEEMGSVNPVICSAYGCTELKYAWADCGAEEDTGYHIYPDMEIVEIIDPDSGEVLKEGETGEIVITNLDARGSVVLRYRTGDIAQGGITFERCPACGRTMPRVSSDIRRIRGKKEFELSKVKGNLIDLNSFTPILNNNIDVLDWVVEIRKRNNDPDDIDQVIIYVCPTYIGQTEGLEKRLIEEVKDSLDIIVDSVIVTSYEEISRMLESEKGEFKRVRDLRPL